jgi:hypothetical protein
VADAAIRDESTKIAMTFAQNPTRSQDLYLIALLIHGTVCRQNRDLKRVEECVFWYREMTDGVAQ